MLHSIGEIATLIEAQIVRTTGGASGMETNWALCTANLVDIHTIGDDEKNEAPILRSFAQYLLDAAERMDQQDARREFLRSKGQLR